MILVIALSQDVLFQDDARVLRPLTLSAGTLVYLSTDTLRARWGHAQRWAATVTLDQVCHAQTGDNPCRR
jgi:hypothetical protein